MFMCAYLSDRNWRVNLDMFMAGRIMYPAMIDALQMLNINVVKIGLLQDKEVCNSVLLLPLQCC